MPRGRLVVLSGPSGVGKTTVGQALLKGNRRMVRSVSATTRAPRPGEKDGRDYRFLTEKAFRAMIRRGGFLEYAEVYGRLYGTPKAPVEKALRRGKDVLLVIDVQGAAQVRKTAPDAVFLFLSPPSWRVLVKRLKGRGTEALAALRRRLRTAKRELAQRWHYDRIIVNDRLGEAVREIRKVLKGCTGTNSSPS